MSAREPACARPLSGLPVRTNSLTRGTLRVRADWLLGWSSVAWLRDNGASPCRALSCCRSSFFRLRRRANGENQLKTHSGTLPKWAAPLANVSEFLLTTWSEASRPRLPRVRSALFRRAASDKDLSFLREPKFSRAACIGDYIVRTARNRVLLSTTR
jgi:hypothetical protein